MVSDSKAAPINTPCAQLSDSRTGGEVSESRPPYIIPETGTPFGLFKSVKRESKIEARIEDKLKRIQKFASSDKKYCSDYYDAIDDLIGYLILYRIALRGE